MPDTPPSTPSPSVSSPSPGPSGSPGPSPSDSGSPVSSSPEPTEEPSRAPQRTRLEETYTCLIFGEDIVGGCTDTIMVARYNVKEHKIGLVSIPRDLKVRDDMSASNNKINAAYALGGVDRLKAEAEQLLGIPIDYYVKVRLPAFQKLVDAVGGVWFNVPFHMKYDDPTQDLHIDQAAGYRLLSGEDAMEVVRYRQNNRGDDSFGDLGRAGVQQDFLKAMLSQVVAGANFSDIPVLADVLLNYVETNASVNDIIYFGKSLVGLDINAALTTDTLPSSWVYPYMIVDQEKALDTINELLSPYSDETPVTAENVEFLN